MRRAALILGTLIMAGCSSGRISQSSGEAGLRGGVGSIGDIRSYNLTNYDFQIQKASLEITSATGKEKLIASLKFMRPGTYLISLRNTSGIEAARFYITPDTILVNDRINRKLFHASPGYLKDKYGLSTIYLPVILGDLVGSMEKNEKVECRNGEYAIFEKTDSENLGFTVDCSKGKVREVKSGNSNSDNRIIIQFDKFRNEGSLFFAGEINIRNEDEQEAIKMTIERISAGITEDIVFIPGKNYEDVILK